MHREDLDDFEKAEAIIHIFEARLGYGLTSNISRITKDKKILKTCKVIDKLQAERDQLKKELSQQKQLDDY